MVLHCHASLTPFEMAGDLACWYLEGGALLSNLPGLLRIHMSPWASWWAGYSELAHPCFPCTHCIYLQIIDLTSLTVSCHVHYLCKAQHQFVGKAAMSVWKSWGLLPSFYFPSIKAFLMCMLMILLVSEDISCMNGSWKPGMSPVSECKVLIERLRKLES